MFEADLSLTTDVRRWAVERDTLGNVKSARLGAELEHRLVQAAEVEGVSVSELIRQAVSERCDTILSSRLDVRLADVVGSFQSGGGWSEVSDERMADLIHEDAQRSPG